MPSTKKEDWLPIRKKAKTNVRERLNDFVDMATLIVENLKPKLEGKQILDKEEREAFKLAVDTVARVRELQIKDKTAKSAYMRAKMTELIDVTPAGLTKEEEKEMKKLAAMVVNQEKNKK